MSRLSSDSYRVLITISVLGLGMLQVSREKDWQVIDLTKLEQKDLVVGPIRAFAGLQNVTEITACLPLPEAAGETML